jgi:hypothetical protein
MNADRICELPPNRLADYVWLRLTGEDTAPPLAERFRQESPADILIRSAYHDSACRQRIIDALAGAIRRYIRELPAAEDRPNSPFIEVAGFLIERIKASELRQELRGLLIALAPTERFEPDLSVPALTRLLRAYLKIADSAAWDYQLVLLPYCRHASPQVRAVAIQGLATTGNPEVEQELTALLDVSGYEPDVLIWNLAATPDGLRLLARVGGRSESRHDRIIAALRFSGGDDGPELEAYRQEHGLLTGNATAVGDAFAALKDKYRLVLESLKTRQLQQHHTAVVRNLDRLVSFFYADAEKSTGLTWKTVRVVASDRPKPLTIQERILDTQQVRRAYAKLDSAMENWVIVCNAFDEELQVTSPRKCKDAIDRFVEAQQTIVQAESQLSADVAKVLRDLADAAQMRER